jgi:ParB family chromosome partitioning protein
MRTPVEREIERIAVAEVTEKNRLRPVADAAVESLMASIRELGVLKDALHVRRRKDGTLVLIAGAHRLEAARRLGWDTVPARVWSDVTDDWARLMEVDDNIAGAELNALDTAIFLAERKAIYEKLHPEMAAGTFKGNQHTGNLVGDIVSFTSATAEKFGLSERHVKRLVAAGHAIRGDAQRLRTAPRPVTLKDLTELSKVGGAPERYAVVDALVAGRAKSAAEARRAWAAKDQPPAPEKDPVEEAFKALAAVWKRSPKAARRRFVDGIRAEIDAMADGSDDE